METGGQSLYAASKAQSSDRIRAGFEQLKATGEDQRLEAASVAGAYRFFDKDGPATRKHREVTRADFETYVEVCKGLTELSAVWNSATFTDRTNVFLAGSIKFSEGKIGHKPKADVLWKKRDALLWWALRLIPDFASIFPLWQKESEACVHKTAIDEGLETRIYPKNNLTDLELGLMFQQIRTLDRGVENWKQHYLAWLIVYITGTRPGSFTVAPGYEEGAVLTERTKREADATLRWHNINFIRYESGIGARVTFEFTKGHRDPYRKQMVSGTRVFNFFPSAGDRLEFDPSLVLAAIAFERGLFPYDSAEDLFDGKERYVPKIEAVDALPVFIAADHYGMLDAASAAMHETALNVKLQEMCQMVGLYERNTMYSFRRTALVEQKRTEGAESARELAFHAPNSSTIYAYDCQPMEDLDIVATRLGENPLFGREEIRRIFSQANERVLIDKGDTRYELREEMDQYVSHALRQNSNYIQMEKDMAAALFEAAQALGITTSRHLYGYQERVMSSLRDRDEGSMKEKLAHLTQLATSRVALRDKMKRSFRVDFRNAKIEEQKKRLSRITREGGVSDKALEIEGAPPKIDPKFNTQKASDQAERDDLNDLNDLIKTEDDADRNQSSADIDEEVLQDQDQVGSGREEPVNWETLPDEVNIDTSRGDAESTAATRLAFFKTYASMSSRQTSSLGCFMCLLDPTVGDKKKKQTYVLAKLDVHIKSAFHSRKEQLMRAFTAEKAKSKKVTCILCPEEAGEPEPAVFTDAKKYLDHMEEEHPWAVEA